MKRLGFIHDMMDVKVLILFVAGRVQYPMSAQEVYELCYQDECLSYFDVCTALPEMVASGHMSQSEDERYAITEKGKETGKLTEDSLAYSVRQRAENAIDKFNRQLRRQSFVKSQVVPKENGEYTIVMTLDDEMGNLMRLELLAPNQRQALRLGRLFEEKGEMTYNLIMTQLLDTEEYDD